MSTDIRWKQRLDNYQNALQRLTFAVDLAKSRALSDLEKQGLIQAFEFTYELAWNLMRDYFRYLDVSSINGPRDAIRESFQKGIITNGEEWMEMLESRNLTSHTYRQEVADDIATKVSASYLSLLTTFAQFMSELAKK